MRVPWTPSAFNFQPGRFSAILTISKCASIPPSRNRLWTGNCERRSLDHAPAHQPATRTGRHPLLLGAMPFILGLLAAYLYCSNARLAANPGDKLLPAPATIAATIHRYALEEDERSGEYLLWNDTRASLQRLWRHSPLAPSPACAWAWPSACCRTSTRHAGAFRRDGCR